MQGEEMAKIAPYIGKKVWKNRLRQISKSFQGVMFCKVALLISSFESKNMVRRKKISRNFLRVRVVKRQLVSNTSIGSF